jgi:hypothetical protein
LLFGGARNGEGRRACETFASHRGVAHVVRDPFESFQFDRESGFEVGRCSCRYFCELVRLVRRRERDDERHRRCRSDEARNHFFVAYEPLLPEISAVSESELVPIIGLTDQAPATLGESASIRQKAFALFVRTYENARRAVLYLRSEAGDGDDIAPSLYANRARRKPNEDEPAPPPPPSDPAAVEASEPQFHNAAGLPIGNPFST